MVFFFLVQGIPESAEVAVPVGRFGSGQATETDASVPAPVSGAPNTAPLNMFPQVSFDVKKSFVCLPTFSYFLLGCDHVGGTFCWRRRWR